MEEDINIIKLIMNETYSNMVNIDGKRIYKLSDRKRQAIENLIKGYKELEEENIKLHTEIAEVVYWESSSVEQIKQDYILKSKVIEKIEEQYGKLCMELGSYERDNATSHQERIAGGINELRKLKKELLQEGDK